MRSARVGATAAALGLLTWFAVGCGSEDAIGPGGEQTTLTVLAAASLTEAFTDLADRFEQEHPGVEVRLAFDSSATLAAQVVEGAPADVLATADSVTMDEAVDGGALRDGPRSFASNVMTLVVPAGNPGGIEEFADLDGDVAYVVCVASAPCGHVAATLLEKAGITAEPASLETDVKAVLAKVTQDEADAGLVYRTDASAAGPAVESLEIPDAEQEPLEYPIGVLQQAQDVDLAREFVDLVLSEDGRSVLTQAGFASP